MKKPNKQNQINKHITNMLNCIDLYDFITVLSKILLLSGTIDLDTANKITMNRITIDNCPRIIDIYTYLHHNIPKLTKTKFLRILARYIAIKVNTSISYTLHCIKKSLNW
jgi:hypothetical protein